MDTVYEDKKTIKPYLKLYCSTHTACMLTAHTKTNPYFCEHTQSFLLHNEFSNLKGEHQQFNYLLFITHSIWLIS